MSEDLTPRQQILMWELISRGGSAMQRDLKPDVAKMDRERLERGGFISVCRGAHGAFMLSLQEEKSWDYLAHAPAGLLAKSKGSIYDRPLLQFAIESMQKFAESNGIALSQVLAGARIVSPDSTPSNDAESYGDDRQSIEQQVKTAFFSIAGRPAINQVRLRSLRERLAHISRADLDQALIRMQASRGASFSTLSNPPDIAEQGDAGLTVRDQTFHTIWIEI